MKFFEWGHFGHALYVSVCNVLSKFVKFGVLMLRNATHPEVNAETERAAALREAAWMAAEEVLQRREAAREARDGQKPRKTRNR